MDIGIVNLTENATFDGDQIYTISLSPLDVVNAFSAVLSAIANAVIIFLIAKWKTLHTRTNIYLVNWCVCNFFVLISAPVSVNLFGWIDEISYEILCIWEETLNGVLFGNLVFVTVLLMHWYTSTFCGQSCGRTCRNSLRFIIGIVWVFIGVLSVTSVVLCVQNYSYPLTLMCYFIGYLATFLLMLIIFILRCIKMIISNGAQTESKLELFLVMSYFLCWLPNCVCLYAQLLLLRATYTIIDATYCIGYINACILMTLLYFCDGNFKKCFRKTFGLESEPLIEKTGAKEIQNNVLL